MVISEIKDGSTVAIGEVDHHARLYSFSHFVPKIDSSLLLTHANEESRLWNEKRGSPLHALEEQPTPASSPQIDVNLQDDSSSTTYQILDQISKSDLNDHDHGMDDKEIRPKWAQKTLQSVDELVGDPIDQ